MAIPTTPHTRDHDDPAQSDFDENELSDKVGKGYDGQEFQELKDAQSGGQAGMSGMTNFGGNERNVEPDDRFVSTRRAIGRRPRRMLRELRNHSLSEETKQQEKVAGPRPDAIGPVDPKE